MRCSLLAVVLVLVAGAAGAQDTAPQHRTIGPSGLPLPRFVSLGTDKAYMRSGPGDQYPILWIYVRRGVPLEVTAEYDVWRRVRDVDGTQGWMHTSLLSGARRAVITGAVRSLHARPKPDAPVLMRVEAGVEADLLECRPGWCRLGLAGRKGWIRRDAFWGSYGGERFD